MQRVTLSSRGQIVIPAELRKKMGLRPGARLMLYDSGSKMTLVPELGDPVEEGFGFIGKRLAQNQGSVKSETT